MDLHIKKLADKMGGKRGAGHQKTHIMSGPFLWDEVPGV